MNSEFGFGIFGSFGDFGGNGEFGNNDFGFGVSNNHNAQTEQTHS